MRTSPVAGVTEPMGRSRAMVPATGRGWRRARFVVAFISQSLSSRGCRGRGVVQTPPARFVGYAPSSVSFAPARLLDSSRAGPLSRPGSARPLQGAGLSKSRCPQRGHGYNSLVRLLSSSLTRLFFPTFPPGPSALQLPAGEGVTRGSVMVRGPAEGAARGGGADATGAGRAGGDEPLRHRQARARGHPPPLGHGGGAVQGAGGVLRLVPAPPGRAPAGGPGAAAEAVGGRSRTRAAPEGHPGPQAEEVNGAK